MQKLSKEQAAWLIAQMQKDIINWENKYPSGSYAFIKDMFEIINQCTKTEPTQYKGYMRGPGGTMHEFKYSIGGENQCTEEENAKVNE